MRWLVSYTLQVKIMTESNYPNKRVRLILWWVLYRVALDVDIEANSLWRLSAREHLKLDKDGLRGIAIRFPRHWARMLEKRARRLAYARANGGYCPEGWTPPAPGETIRNPPLIALAKRHELGLMGVMCQYHAAMEANYMAKRGL
jgi:hypothetical protein